MANDRTNSYRLAFLMPSPRHKLRTLAHYNTFLENLISIYLYDWGNVKDIDRSKEIFVSCRLA